MGTQHVPFTTNNLREFEAQIQKMFFVFNVNETLLKENEFTYRRRDLTSSPYAFGGPSFSLTDCTTPFMMQSLA